MSSMGESDAKTHRTPKALRAKFIQMRPLPFAKLWECARVLASLFGALSSALRANAPEFESGLGFYDLAVHLEERINEEINRSTLRFRIDHKIAALGQFEPISRIMTKIIISQLWVLPRFADVYRHPLTVCEKFGPAMVALDLALILVDWNGGADGETCGYVDASRQSNEIRMKIRAVSGAGIARIDGVSSAPTIT